MQLAVYLLIDTSASMYGASIQAAADAYPMISHYIEETCSGHDIDYSLVAYHSEPVVLFDKVPFADIQVERRLTVQGSSNLRRALQLMLKREAETASDRRVCVILTDDEATDDWDTALNDMRPNNLLLIVVGCGSHANIGAYRPYCDMVEPWQQFQQEAFQQILQTYIR